MGCASCGSSANGLPAGCRNNGACGQYGCSRMDSFDWLAGVQLPDGQKPFDIVEVRFKNGRKSFYRTGGLELVVGDVIAVESSPGHDIGVVALTGELVRAQMKRKGVKDDYQVRKVYRKAKQEDIERWQEARMTEPAALLRAREIARSLGLEMKLTDVEYQGDRSKATFFYSAEDRVDFRELIRRYAEEFRVKIEMRQVGLRVEAGRLGGIGVCGRELCCSSWMSDFRSVSTAAARYQQLSLNPTKLAGQCGKLKCCLNYELDQYLEALRDFPSSNVKLQLAKGTAYHVKTDIFQRMMDYAVEGQETDAPIGLSLAAVREIIEKNRRGERPEDFSAFVAADDHAEEPVDFANVVGQDSLNRFDRKKSSKRPQRQKGKGSGGDRPQSGQQQPRQREGGGERPRGGQPPRQRDQNRPPRPDKQGPPRQGNDKPKGEGSDRGRRPPRKPNPGNNKPNPGKENPAP
ncbi:MAG: hypothetical protein JNM00_02955 [Flavobacteriales bacterium]|nr:hypothetical protein [Flavobacteriales bacterium]